MNETVKSFIHWSWKAELIHSTLKFLYQISSSRSKMAARRVGGEGGGGGRGDGRLSGRIPEESAKSRGINHKTWKNAE